MLLGVQPSSTLQCENLSVKQIINFGKPDKSPATSVQSNSAETKSSKKPKTLTTIIEKENSSCADGKEKNVRSQKDMLTKGNESQAISAGGELPTKKRKRDKSVPAAKTITLNDKNSDICIISNDTCTKEQVTGIENTLTKREKKKKKKARTIETMQVVDD